MNEELIVVEGEQRRPRSVRFKAWIERNDVETIIGLAVIVGATTLAGLRVLSAEQVMYIYIAILGYIFGRAQQ